MASSITMSWKGDRDLVLNLRDKRVDDRVKRIIAGQFLYASDEATRFAKENAPWTDRTGNARAGLHSGVSEGLDKDFFELYIAHTVFYGIYLETRWNGKYAIIAPTVVYIGAKIMERMESVFEKLAGEI